jgi:hypothetical protein
MSTNPLNENTHGQGATHAVGGPGNSKVPNTVQNKAPQGLEESLPDSVSDPPKFLSGEHPRD